MRRQQKMTASWLVAIGFLSVLAINAGASEPVEEAAGWDQWRGPNRTCEVAGSPVWPDSLDEGRLVEQFRVPLGDSYSGPIVAGDRVFVTETVGGKSETVRALNRETGEEIWQAEWEGSMTVPFFAAANGSWIRSTPAWADGRLFVGGIRDVLVCLSGEDGKELWRLDFTKEFGTPIETFGFVCSPLVDGDVLYVQSAAGLVCVECATGKIVWRGLVEAGGMMGGAFSSPILAEVQGMRQLVVQTRARLVGVDPATGKELWGVNIPSFRGMNILTPTLIGDRVFTSSYGGGSFLHEVTREGDTWGVSEVWKAKTEAYMSSPVVVDGKIYLHLRNQRFTCLDASDGGDLWTTRPFGKYWSMVRNGDRLLVLDQRGDLLLVTANPGEYQEESRRHVSDSETWAHLAVAGDQVFVRELDGLRVFRWK